MFPLMNNNHCSPECRRAKDSQDNRVRVRHCMVRTDRYQASATTAVANVRKWIEMYRAGAAAAAASTKEQQAERKQGETGPVPAGGAAAAEGKSQAGGGAAAPRPGK